MSIAEPGIASRFTRSVQLTRDFDLRRTLAGYVVTPLVIETAARVVGGLQPGGERAFSIIGPYGAGKSACGLFIAHWLQRGDASRRQLARRLDVESLVTRLDSAGPSLLAVLVAGGSGELRRAIVAATQLAVRRAAHPGWRALADALGQAAEAATPPTPAGVAALLADATAHVRDGGRHAGILLVIDELGQSLADAARRDDEHDLYVLQELAEQAARSDAAPLLVLTILHQGFEHYARGAGAARRDEWARVQGRFAAITFQEPATQVLRLIGRALAPAHHAAWAERHAGPSLALGLCPADMTPHEWSELLAATWPLHPTVLVALPALFRQLAQNERSLFAFLYADEPWGLRDVQRSGSDTYRLEHLYAYVEAILGPALFHTSRGRRWAELAEARAGRAGGDAAQLALLTAIGTLHALDRASGLRASPALLAYAQADDPADQAVGAALAELVRRRAIVWRAHRGVYLPWEGSDVDVAALVAEARRDIAARESLASLLERSASLVPRVARRHSYRHGTTRVIVTRCVTPGDLAGLAPPVAAIDGELLLVVPADDDERRVALDWAGADDRGADLGRVVVVPRAAHDLRDVLLEVVALHHTLEAHVVVRHDGAARRELGGQLLDAREALAAVIARLGDGRESLWWYRGRHLPDVVDARRVDEALSRLADERYPLAPRVWNELIMRTQLSTAAARARRVLVEALMTQAHVATLGIVGYPPERAIYESVLAQTGIHRHDGARWVLAAPADDHPANLAPAWRAIEGFLAASTADARPVAELYQLIEAPPYGVRRGLGPLLLLLVLQAGPGDVALYEHGTLVATPEPATWERLLRQPAQFAVRRTALSGARRQVFLRLAQVLAPAALQRDGHAALLAAVTPLLREAQRWPAYTRATRQVSATAQAIRQALFNARAHDALLFEALPQACGVPPFAADAPADPAHVDAFFAGLRAGLLELQAARTTLADRVEAQLAAAFGVAAPDRATLHATLRRRAAPLVPLAHDPLVRAFLLRLDHETAWLESVAALVARRPLDAWADADAERFATAVRDLARRFQLAEELALLAGQLPADAAVLRLGLADPRGERSSVVDARDCDDQLLAALRQTLDVHAATSHRTLATLATVLMELLQPVHQESNDAE
ncbi:MAG: hypothetical protein KGS47_12335 [Chloroflexi bacterium]|nr:hypothetical protein [Chloroflexota bacterium]